MPPRTHHQIIICRLALRLQGQITMNRSPHVFLVPQALNPHRRNLRRMLRHQLIQRLPLPESIVSRMLDHLLRPRQLIQSIEPRISARRSRPAETLIVVEGTPYHIIALVLLGRLAGRVIEVGLTERAVMKPVVTHPSVHHGTLRSRHLQRRMRIEQRRHHGEPLIGRADHAHASVRFGSVLHQPVDGVIGIRNVVRRGAVQRSANRPRHHVVAL